MAVERALSPGFWLHTLWKPLLYCINCGDRVDETILANRARARPRSREQDLIVA